MKLRIRVVLLIALVIIFLIVLIQRSGIKRLPHLENKEYEITGSIPDDEKHQAPEEGHSEASADFRTRDLWSRVDRMARKKETELPDYPQDVGNDFLEAIVVPHSHNDPGWLKTVDGYFQEQTSHILDSMLEKLQVLPNMTFIWSETVFLAMWWERLPEIKRERVKELIQGGRLEIVGGGWVVPDEAVTHYSSLVLNFLEGHLWLRSELGVRPRHTWSLDPFGYSSTLPYLYGRIGFDSSVVLRIHSDIKRLMYAERLMEFRWRQHWDILNTTDMRTFMLPYKLYNIKHQCGPDTAVCLNYDFRRVYGEISESTAVPVTEENVGQLARDLVGQYRLKAALQRNKRAVLIPLGDDFRYDRSEEWDQQYANYMKLFDHINSRPHVFNVRARFGTLSDFFDALDGRAGLDRAEDDFEDYVAPMPKSGPLAVAMPPVLSGDFFPYSDTDGEYWTGFYSTRMWLKRLGRLLAERLHEAEVAYLRLRLVSLGAGSIKISRSVKWNEALREARRTSALFQHHDAVTGTSKEDVASDYALMLNSALQDLTTVMEQILGETISALVATSKGMWGRWEGGRAHGLRLFSRHLNFDRLVTTEDVGTELVLANVRFVDLSTPVSVRISPERPILRVLEGGDSGEGKPVECQVVGRKEPTLWLVPSIGPHLLRTYRVLPGNRTHSCHETKYHLLRPGEGAKVGSIGRGFSVDFDPDSGHPSLITTEDGLTVSIRVSFRTYSGDGHRLDKNGAYLFHSLGRSAELPTRGRILHGSGALVHVVKVKVGDSVSATYRIQKGGSGEPCIHLEVTTNLTRPSSKNLVMDIWADIDSGRAFHVDSNGFSAVGRERMPSLPVEANYYPATSYAFIEDRPDSKRPGPGGGARLTILMSDPHGVSSPEPGTIEVMLDRILQYDDGRGLGSGVVDNVPTTTSFKILVERLPKRRNKKKVVEEEGAEDAKVGETKQKRGTKKRKRGTAEPEIRNPTSMALELLERMRQPPIQGAMVAPTDDERRGLELALRAFNVSRLPEGVGLASIRNLEAQGLVSAHLVFHRHATDPPEGGGGGGDCGFRVASLFPQDISSDVRRTSLTMDRVEPKGSGPVETCFGTSELEAFKVVFWK